MADLKPADDLIHPWLPDPFWRESYYFEFFDERLGIGGFHTMGERPIKNHSGFLLAIWGVETLTLVRWDKVQRTETTHRCAGMEYTCEEPLQRWRTRFEGEAYRMPIDQLRVPHPLVDVRPAGPATPVRVSFDMTFSALNPAYGYEAGGPWAPIFSGHIDQAGLVQGALRIGEHSYQIDGTGFRDRSWGIRDWCAPQIWTYFVVQADDDTLVAFWRPTFDGQTVVDGFVARGGRNRRITNVDVEVDYGDAAELPVPVACRLDILDDSGSHLRLAGETVRSIPVVLKRGPSGEPGPTAWVDRCLVRVKRPDGNYAHGVFEHQRRIIR